jgi:hypothetical protein
MCVSCNKLLQHNVACMKVGRKDEKGLGGKQFNIELFFHFWQFYVANYFESQI